MKKPTIKRGFKAVKEEEQRKEKAKEASQGRLWRIFFPRDADEDHEIPVTFLTDEPVCYHEHNIKVQGKIENHACVGEGCKYCDEGDRPRFVGAFLVVDHTEFKREERDAKGNKTGKKVKDKDKVKLLVRGSTDLAKLDKLNKRKGLLGIKWSIYKTGTEQSTSWNFDSIEENEYSKKEIQALLPEKLRNMDLYTIIEEQVTPEEEEEDGYENDNDDNDTQGGVQNYGDDDDQDEEETPKKKKLGSKKPVAKSTTPSKIKKKIIKRK